MPLYSETYGCRSGNGTERPVLVFLHGLLGSGQDWRQVVNTLSASYDCLTIDLPGHGHSQLLMPSDFEQVNRQILQTLSHRNVRSYVLIGYSMGARLAMYHACFLDNQNRGKLVGMVLEGGHFGLPRAECATRLANDQKWAQRFASEPISQVLADWYQQSVFSSLNHDQRQSLIVKRSDNLGAGIARMLQATSLAKQPELQLRVEQLSFPVHYICGENDNKFRSLAENSGLDLTVIPSAGHNVHVELPHEFSMAVTHFLDRLE
ncbi:2-succinyl-6-hydroxy-2,4-cyclohexadiene-1-carboxylate synthase [Photobacterium sp. OFAV2-7]|uniref:2-succinyl-6-hydroxy-2, 4-cyclohexadiene-1-carboxylate synthase n=1 Tax=Photobacterium sp. OFAV2-7 TaxID=2917748 RepID=UPI001EF46CC7|nr:2-succinyl-6-hydroxy-2,4-cyclohexadiene-1-carboxylate synthase [Photobacterium sp. OFAV2-7]MCG7586905.1 2-succinyl-6-hydroxy-2,4-cyclohexadiene-1-carboxylate synthase [Photobacterium sp. OFAV2-7]